MEHTIGSLEQAQAIILQADPSVSLSLVVDKACSLNEARRIWKAVREGPAGFASLSNPDILVGKEGAYQFVHQKLRQLGRRIKNLSKVLTAIDESIQHLEQVLADGGPGVTAGFEPRTFKGAQISIDTDEIIGDDDLETHIYETTAMIMQVSPGSPTPESEEELTERESDEQRVVAEFNLAYLRVKQKALSAERNQLIEGADELTADFLTLPTLLGSSSSDFVRFLDHSTYAGELKGN